MNDIGVFERCENATESRKVTLTSILLNNRNRRIYCLRFSTLYLSEIWKFGYRLVIDPRQYVQRMLIPVAIQYYHNAKIR